MTETVYVWFIVSLIALIAVASVGVPMWIHARRIRRLLKDGTINYEEALFRLWNG